MTARKTFVACGVKISSAIGYINIPDIIISGVYAFISTAIIVLVVLISMNISLYK